MLGGKQPKFVLASPNFRAGDEPPLQVLVGSEESTAKAANAGGSIVEVVHTSEAAGDAEATLMIDGFQMVLFRFFRELTEGERLKILVDLGAISGSTTERLTQALERRLLELLVKRGLIVEVNAMIGTLLAERRMKGVE